MKHGQPVKFTDYFVREMRDGMFGMHTRGARKWVKAPHKFEGKPCVSEGIFLGLRTINNGGYQDVDGSDDPTTHFVYVAEEYFKAALVSPGPRRNPIYVPLDSIEEVKKTTFGQRLKEERIAAGVKSARKMAEKLGMNIKTYYNYETDKNKMSVGTLKQIIEALYSKYEEQVGALGFLVGPEGEV